MNDLRKAAQQALEALEYSAEELREYSIDMSGEEYNSPLVNDAITALREQLAEPVQEPVAWMDREGDLYKMPEIEGWAPPHTMLYTAPPQRKPLSEENIRALYDQHAAYQEEGPEVSGWWDFARAIERAHGIGGQE